MATERSGRCRELERQLEAERRQHALELESLQRQHIEDRLDTEGARAHVPMVGGEGRLQASLTSLSPVRSTAPGASRLAALAKSVPCSNVDSIVRTRSSEGLKLSARNDEVTTDVQSILDFGAKSRSAWPARFAPPLVGPSCLAPVLPCSDSSRAPRASPVLSQYLCSSPDTRLIPSPQEGCLPERPGSSRLLMASAARANWHVAGRSCSPRQELSCSPMQRRQTLLGDAPAICTATTSLTSLL